MKRIRLHVCQSIRRRKQEHIPICIYIYIYIYIHAYAYLLCIYLCQSVRRRKHEKHKCSKETNNVETDDRNVLRPPRRRLTPQCVDMILSRGQSPYYDSGVQRVRLKHDLDFRGRTSHVPRGFPGNVESANLGRDNLSREIGPRRESDARF